jgi:hypothetical protein
MIAEVLFTQRQPVNALTQQVDLPMGDQVRIARVFPHCIQCPAKLRVPICRPEHHDFPVTGDISPPPKNLPQFFGDQNLEKGKVPGYRLRLAKSTLGVV